MYNYRIWDGQDVGNISAKAIMTDLNDTTEQVALIFNDDILALIQTEGMRAYLDLPFEQAIQKQVDELNKGLIAEQAYNDTKAGYLAGTITDEQLAELVVAGKLTQSQADEIKASKTQA